MCDNKADEIYMCASYTQNSTHTHTHTSEFKHAQNVVPKRIQLLHIGSVPLGTHSSIMQVPQGPHNHAHNGGSFSGTYEAMSADAQLVKVGGQLLETCSPTCPLGHDFGVVAVAGGVVRVGAGFWVNIIL